MKTNSPSAWSCAARRDCLVGVAAHSMGTHVRGTPRVSVPVLLYVIVQAVLVATALLARPPFGALASYLVGLTGTVTLTIGLLRRSPAPLAGWRWVVAGAWVVMLAAVVGAIVTTPDGRIAIEVSLPALVAVCSFPLFVIGLVRLSPSTGGVRLADVLDAIMASLMAYLLLWVFVIEPNSDRLPLAVLGAAVFPIGVLLVFTIAMKLILAGGLREPATRLLILGLLALLASSLVDLVPVITATATEPAVGRVFWCLYGIGLGAAGLHPALARTRPLEQPSTNDASRWRIGLFAVLALVPPVVWTVELRRTTVDEGTVVYLAPVALSGMFLLLLVARLDNQHAMRSEDDERNNVGADVTRRVARDDHKVGGQSLAQVRRDALREACARTVGERREC